jgi:hypothetical protein
MASTAQLVRGVRDGRSPPEVRMLMSERRRMLQELVLQEADPVNALTLESLEEAVAESDRTLEALLGAPGN